MLRPATRRATARYPCGRRSRPQPGVRGAQAGFATASRERSFPAHPPHMRCGRPTSWRSAPPTTRCNDGRPTPGHGCLRCPASAPRIGCPDAFRPSTEVPSSMVKSQREWEPADEDTDDEPADGEPAPSDKAPAKREPPARLKRFGDAVVVRLPRISAAVFGGLLLCPELPAVRLVVHRDRRVRAVGLGADQGEPPSSSADRLRLPVRGGLLSPAVAVDRRNGRADAMGGAFPCAGRLCRLVRHRRCRGAQADRMAARVRGPVGVGGVGQVDGAVRRIPLGGNRFRANRRPAAAACTDRRRAVGVVRGDIARIQRRRADVRDRRLVAAR